jgi:hypothetical protein
MDHAISVQLSIMRSQYLLPLMLLLVNFEISMNMRYPGVVERGLLSFEIGDWPILVMAQYGHGLKSPSKQYP